MVERIQHGYDLAGNRLWRNELADPTAAHDELYGYDGVYRLKEMQRGTLNSNETAIVPMNFAQCWGLDAAGNWQNFREDDTSSATWNLVQTRSSNRVNEITNIASIAGPTWVTPTYNPAGNMTILPQPAAPGSSYNATYDAWNRLMTLSSAGSSVAGYQYDGLKRRTVKNTYTGGVLTQTRHQYYSAGWQVLEERIGGSTTPDRQFVWGLRYVDDLLLRDRNTTGGSTLNERFYGLQDPNWNLTAIVDITGTVQERYVYSPYGVPTVLTPAFGTRAATLFKWETLYAGYRWDSESGLYQVRNRIYQSQIGVWIQRDPQKFRGGNGNQLRFKQDLNLFVYVSNYPLNAVDPDGRHWEPATPVPAICTFSHRETGHNAARPGRRHNWGATCVWMCECRNDPSSPLERVQPGASQPQELVWEPYGFSFRAETDCGGRPPSGQVDPPIRWCSRDKWVPDLPPVVLAPVQIPHTLQCRIGLPSPPENDDWDLVPSWGTIYTIGKVAAASVVVVGAAVVAPVAVPIAAGAAVIVIVGADSGGGA